MLSLQNICIDSIILSDDPDIVKSIITLPSFILKMIDDRDKEICHTRKYKKRFTTFNDLNHLDHLNDEEEDYSLSEDRESEYDEEDSGEDEPWFDPSLTSDYYFDDDYCE